MVSALPPVSLHFRQQGRQSLMTMITSDLVMQVTKSTFNEIGSGAVARQPEQDEARGARQPVANIAGSMNALVVRHHVHAESALGSRRDPRPAADSGRESGSSSARS